tara:strand:+ start:1315 stop:1956 length:642 start_codon:yes stop_codon:yes gene_type:complete
MTTVISECHVFKPEVNKDYLLYLMKSSRGKDLLKRNANLEIENISEILFIVTKNRIPEESQFLDTPTMFTESSPFISQVAVRMKDTGEYVLLKVYDDSLEEQLNKLLVRFPVAAVLVIKYEHAFGIWRAVSQGKAGMVYIDTIHKSEPEFTPQEEFHIHPEIDIEEIFTGGDCVITQRGGGKKKSKQRKKKSKSKKRKRKSKSKKRRNKSKRR